MMASKPLPAHHELKPYSHAVAGHEGTLCDPDGEYFIKPCVQAEIDFYEAAHGAHPEFAKLMPGYYGTLQLADIKDVQSLDAAVGPEAASHMSAEFKEEAVHMALEMVAAEAAAEATPPPEQDNITWKPNKSRKIATDKSVVLENLAFGFKHPNILDAKLGKRLWADDAPMEKKVRFDDISARTTNGSHGFRIAGMRVFKGSADTEKLDQEGYMVYDKYYGRDTVNSGNINDAMKSFIFNKHAGITKDLGKRIAGKFLEELRVVEKVLEAEGSRMYSASLLFTFEGCGETLREAIEAAPQGPATEQAPNSAATETATSNGEKAENAIEFSRPFRVDSGIEDEPRQPKIPDFSASRTDSGIVLEADDEKMTEAVLETVQEEVQVIINGAEVDMEDVESFEVLDMTDEEEEEGESSAPRICSLKLIDFAHAKFLPKKAGSGDGESGPDLNVLHGVKSLIKIFEEFSTTDSVDEAENEDKVADVRIVEKVAGAA